MATSSSRLTLRRLPTLRACAFSSAAARPSMAVARSCVASLTKTSSYSTFKPVNSLLLATKRKNPGLLDNAVKFRSYSDLVVKVPTLAESLSEGTLKQWQKKVGDYVKADEEIATIETDKIDVSVNAPAAGTITEILAQEEETVEVGQDLCKMDTSAEAPAAAVSAPEAPKAPAVPKSEAAPAPAAPVAAAPPPSPPPPAAEPPRRAPPTQAQHPENVTPSIKTAASHQDPFSNRGEQRVAMTRMRLRIAERLKQSQDTAASLTTFNEVDMSQIMEMRSLYNGELAEKAGTKLGFLSAFCKAVVLAMKDVPAVNASIEGPNGGNTLVFRDYVDISIAVATQKGLVTPVVRNVESMDLLDIEKAIAALGVKAREGKITLEDMAGGTFTISNGGIFGSLMGTPIINLPQTAVLGLHAIKERPVVVKGEIVIRPMMYLALTYDHRVLDGREAVTFLVKVKEYMEDPRKMLLTYNLV